MGKICPKRVTILSKTEKVNITINFKCIGISPCAKFHHKQRRFLRQNFSNKGYFWPERDQVKIIVEFSIFELAYLRNFSLNRQFWCFELNLQKKGNDAYYGIPRKCAHVWKLPSLIFARFSWNIRQKKFSHFKIPISSRRQIFSLTFLNFVSCSGICINATNSCCLRLWILPSLLQKVLGLVKFLLGY